MKSKKMLVQSLRVGMVIVVPMFVGAAYADSLTLDIALKNGGAKPNDRTHMVTSSDTATTIKLDDRYSLKVRSALLPDAGHVRIFVETVDAQAKEPQKFVTDTMIGVPLLIKRTADGNQDIEITVWQK